MERKRSQQRGFTLMELLIVIAIILIIITIALPKFTAAQRFARETAAMAAIRTIHTMEVQYYSQYGKYATALTEFGPPASGAAAGPAGADLIDSTLSTGEKGGYKFVLAANGGGYMINANPINFGVSGSRTFFSDQSMVLRQNFGQEPATLNSPEVKQ